jgi:hypothetical protein
MPKVPNPAYSVTVCFIYLKSTKPKVVPQL